MLAAEAVAGMAALVAELGELPGWPAVEMDGALVLWDVLGAIGATEAEARAAVGEEVAAYVAGVLGTRVMVEGLGGGVAAASSPAAGGCGGAARSVVA